MTDQNHSDPYQDALTVLEGRRQAAHEAAHEAYRSASTKRFADHRAAVKAQRDILSDRGRVAEHDTARQQLALLDKGVDDRDLREAHAAAIGAADTEFNRQAAALRSQFARTGTVAAPAPVAMSEPALAGVTIH